MPLCTRILLVTLCGLVAACDSGEPETPGPPAAPPAFIGTWMQQTFDTDTYATLSQSQIALDPFSPARGEVRTEGAFTSTLRYLTSRFVDREEGETRLSYTLTSSSRPVPGTPFVVLNLSPRFASMGVYTRAGQDGTAYFPQFPLATPPVLQSGDTLRVGPNVYTVSPGTGASVMVQGMLVLPRRRIEAGVETHMSALASLVNGDAYTRTIGTDGTFTDQNRGVVSRRGTWSAGPDSTVTFDFEGPDTDTRRYRVTGNTLRLSLPTSFSYDATGMSRVEDIADVLPGTVQRARYVISSTFTRSTL